MVGVTVFRKLRQRAPLYESIVRAIEEMILDGKLQPGETLPSERELAVQFAVSRTAVREAMKVLAQKQLVTIIHGKGAVVAHPSSATVTASLGALLRVGRATVIQLAEVRRGLEPEMAALAASRATPAAVKNIARLLAEQKASRQNRIRMATLDIAFHRAIAEAAGNVVAHAMLETIGALFRETVLGGYRVRGAVDRTFAFHEQIVSAIQKGDAPTARRRMWEHMDDLVGGLSGSHSGARKQQSEM